MVERNKIGPVTRDQILILLRRRVLKGSTQVWNSDMPRFVPIEEIDDMAPFIPEDELDPALEPVASEQPPLKGFTRFFVPKKKAEAVGAPRKPLAPFPRPHHLEDEERRSGRRGSTRPAIPGAPGKDKAKRTRPPSPPPKSEEDRHPSAVEQVTGAVSEGVRLLGATALSVGAAIFGVFVLGLIDLLIGPQRDFFYDGMAWLVPREFLTLLDPVEWLGVLIVGGLVGSAASAGCGGRGNSMVAAMAAFCAFASVSVGAIFAEILGMSIEQEETIATLALQIDAWLHGVTAFYHNLLEEPDDLLFLFGAAGEAFLIARHNYRKHDDEKEHRVVDPFLKT
ncbi:MAG: hypothetical protein AAFX93_04730 [Verrucomicrobiota bacterium]